MKKLFLGIIIGIFLSLGTSIYADDIQSLIGRAVQGTFPIQINGSNLQTDAIVVNDTSYLPVRTIGELLNLDISFIDNQVIIKAKEGLVNMDKLKQQKIDADAKQAKWEKDRADNLKQIQDEQDAYDAKAKILKDQEDADREKAKLIKAEDDRKAKESAEKANSQMTPSPSPTVTPTPSK